MNKLSKTAIIIIDFMFVFLAIFIEVICIIISMFSLSYPNFLGAIIIFILFLPLHLFGFWFLKETITNLKQDIKE